MDRATRLKILREIARQYEERNNLVFGNLPPSKRDIQDELGNMDAFVETSRDNQTNRPLTSDER